MCDVEGRSGVFGESLKGKGRWKGQRQEGNKGGLGGLEEAKVSL